MKGDQRFSHHMGIPSNELQAVCNMTGSDQHLAFCKYNFLYPMSIPEHQSGTIDPKKPELNQWAPVVKLVVKFVSPVFYPMIINDTCLQRFFCMWTPCNASSICCFSCWQISWSVKFTSLNIYYNEIVEQQLIDTHTLRPLFLDTSTSEPAPINVSKLTKPVGGFIVLSMFAELIIL